LYKEDEEEDFGGGDKGEIAFFVCILKPNREKYQSDSLRQRFWRQYSKQYDTDDVVVRSGRRLDSIGGCAQYVFIVNQSVLASAFDTTPNGRLDATSKPRWP
jgi:hypothetical protein